MNENEVFSDLNGLKIYDSEKFLKVFYSEDLSQISKNYSSLITYAMKQKSKIAEEIDMDTYSNIINFSIMKTIKDYEEKKGASFESYFFIKLRGEVKGYRSSRNSLQRKVNQVVSSGGNGNIEYGYQKKGEENVYEAIDFSDISEEIEREEVAKRQTKSFRMAFSGIPKELQYILYQIGEGKTIDKIAEQMNVEKDVILVKRNKGLALILQRVMRGRHLTDEDKEYIAKVNEVDLYKDLEEK